MLACNDPYDAYQRVEFDAWVKGASPEQLVQICFDQLIIALTTAILANERCDGRLKSRAITRAVTALIALEMGIDRASSVAFDGGVLAEIRDDFSDMRRAFGR